jgi:hypothetical protein
LILLCILANTVAECQALARAKQRLFCTQLNRRKNQ